MEKWSKIRNDAKHRLILVYLAGLHSRSRSMDVTVGQWIRAHLRIGVVWGTGRLFIHQSMFGECHTARDVAFQVHVPTPELSDGHGHTKTHLCSLLFSQLESVHCSRAVRFSQERDSSHATSTQYPPVLSSSMAKITSGHVTITSYTSFQVTAPGKREPSFQQEMRPRVDTDVFTEAIPREIHVLLQKFIVRRINSFRLKKTAENKLV